jgi:hypothetical protein
MWNRVERIMGPIFDLVCGMSRQEWTLLFVGAVIVGFFCMRGFGSRSKY